MTTGPTARRATAGPWKTDEAMTIAAARRLRDGAVCFVGIGLPSTAANLAKRMHAPGLVLVYESGTLGAAPDRLPLSIGDGSLAQSADSVVSVPEVFNYWLQPGRIDIGFLGAAQVDRDGNLNSTVIGDYAHPAVRLPGAGGAPEIGEFCQDVIVIIRQTPRTFVECVDFVTTLGRMAGKPRRPLTIITDHGVLERDRDSGQLVLTALQPGVTLDDARAATGWRLEAADDLSELPDPAPDELEALRLLQDPTERR